MKSFSEILKKTITRKGDLSPDDLMPTSVKSIQQLKTTTSDRYLASMTKAIFKAGFVWKIIEHKWDGFEEAFWNFNVARCSFISPDDSDSLCQDTRIIRNAMKINTVRINATMITEIDNNEGGFAKLIADWPSTDYIGLLYYLNKQGSRLGKQTSQYFLRDIGKDGFIIGRDSVAALINAGVLDKSPTSKSDYKKLQNAFNQWQDESGLTLAQISRALSMSEGVNAT